MKRRWLRGGTGWRGVGASFSRRKPYASKTSKRGRNKGKVALEEANDNENLSCVCTRARRRRMMERLKVTRYRDARKRRRGEAGRRR